MLNSCTLSVVSIYVILPDDYELGLRCLEISAFDQCVGHMIFEFYFLRSILAVQPLRIIMCRLLHFVTIQLFLISQKHMPFSGINLFNGHFCVCGAAAKVLHVV